MNRNEFHDMFETRKRCPGELTGDRLTDTAQLSFPLELPGMTRAVVKCSIIQKPQAGDVVIICTRTGENIMATLESAPKAREAVYFSYYDKPDEISSIQLQDFIAVLPVVEIENPETVKPERLPRKTQPKSKDGKRACPQGKKRMKSSQKHS